MDSCPNLVRSLTRIGLIQGICLLGLILVFVFPCAAMAKEKSRSIRLPSQKPTAVSSEVGIGDLYAVVVGVAKYSNPRIPKLKLSDKDARDFADFLNTQKQLFREIHLTLLLNEQATQKEVKRQLFYDLRRAGKNDTILLFLAGHGADDPNMPGEFFFLTYDADPDVLEGTAVNMGRSWFMQRLDSKRVLVIADTCHAGGFSKEGARSGEFALKKLMNQFQESEGRIFLTSSRPDEISREEASLGNGIFTYHLLEGLKGKASRSGDGVVTLQEAYEYVYEKTKDATKGMQHPQMEGRVVGKFPMSLVRLESSPTAALEPSSQTSPAQQPPNELDRLRSQAERGDPRSQFELGVKYEYGFGVGKDRAEALRWYSKASEKGNGDARTAMARLTPTSVGPSVSPATPPKPTSSAPSLSQEPAPLKHGFSKNSALLEASEADRVDELERLLSEGADINVKRPNTGETLLHLAARWGNTATAQFLLDRGANIDAKDRDGETALLLAAEGGHAATVQLLLDRGADVNSKDRVGRTALHQAAWYGNNTTVLRLLLDRGTDVDAKDNAGKTALQIAEKRQKREVTEILIDYRGRRTGSVYGNSSR